MHPPHQHLRLHRLLLQAGEEQHPNLPHPTCTQHHAQTPCLHKNTLTPLHLPRTPLPPAHRHKPSPQQTHPLTLPDTKSPEPALTHSRTQTHSLLHARPLHAQPQHTACMDTRPCVLSRKRGCTTQQGPLGRAHNRSSTMWWRCQAERCHFQLPNTTRHSAATTSMPTVIHTAPSSPTSIRPSINQPGRLPHCICMHGLRHMQAWRMMLAVYMLLQSLTSNRRTAQHSMQQTLLLQEEHRVPFGTACCQQFKPPRRDTKKRATPNNGSRQQLPHRHMPARP